MSEWRVESHQGESGSEKPFESTESGLVHLVPGTIIVCGLTLVKLSEKSEDQNDAWTGKGE